MALIDDKDHSRDIVDLTPDPSLNHKGKSWFLGIGINNYQKSFRSLNNACKDIQDFEQLLVERYELDESLTLFDETASRNAIITSFQTLKEKVTSNDKVIIYYAGHGHLDPDDEIGYWIPADAEENIIATYIFTVTVQKLIKSIKAKHILIISDSCFSAAINERSQNNSETSMLQLEQRPSRWVLTSGGKRDKVSDGKPGANSPFAASILRVLRENTRPSLNLIRLYDEMLRLMEWNHNQLPECSPLRETNHEGGQYIFQLKNIQQPAPGSSFSFVSPVAQLSLSASFEVKPVSPPKVLRGVTFFWGMLLIGIGVAVLAIIVIGNDLDLLPIMSLIILPGLVGGGMMLVSKTAFYGGVLAAILMPVVFFADKVDKSAFFWIVLILIPTTILIALLNLKYAAGRKKT